MPKNIVFCADGTWNQPEVSENEDSNVLKFFQHLAGENTPDSHPRDAEQERDALGDDGALVQKSKYLNGVGSGENALAKALDGAVGGGLITRIVRGYTFISRNYRDGDTIFIVGFSRGAYTARALAGLIQAKGLMDATKNDLEDKANAYRLGTAVWHQRSRDLAAADTNILGKIQIYLTGLSDIFSRAPAAGQMIRARIKAVGVWDTVGALGIPEFDASHEQIDTFRFDDNVLSGNVDHGFHAVSLDEQRPNFAPTLWDADPARVTQVLFPGAHSDVGGGYPECGLSDAALVWMTDALARAGVGFAASPEPQPKPDALAVAHKPWLHGVLAAVPPVRRPFVGALERSESLRRRLGQSVISEPGEAADIYAPPNLPAAPGS